MDVCAGKAQNLTVISEEVTLEAEGAGQPCRGEEMGRGWWGQCRSNLESQAS